MNSMTDQARLTWALVLSVIVHGLVLSLMPLWRSARVDLQLPALVDVDLVSLPKPAPPPPPRAPAAAAPAAPAPPAPAIPVPQRQIVAPPEEGEEKAPENARFLSDRDNTVKEETVKRGEPLPGDPAARPRPPEPIAKLEAKPAPKPAAKPVAAARQPRAADAAPRAAALPNLEQLLPQPGDLLRGGGRPAPGPAEAQPAPEQQVAVARGPDLLRYGDPWRRGSTRGGTLDFLPTIREGDITLLNTKAEMFAPFVRRVAVRVFENFVILLRRSYGETGTTEEFAAVEAVMDRQGNLVKLITQDRSVSIALSTDRNLQAAVREGFFDRNPPSGAESADGNIHFAFQARVALVLAPDGRRIPAWALLGAGLM
jgi:hypothetical protein